MSIASILSTLRVASPGDAEVLDIVPEDNAKKAFELRSRGVPIVNIAKAFSVSEATIYRWLDNYKSNFSTSYVKRPRSEILMDMLRFVTVVRDAAMQTVHQIELTETIIGPGGKRIKNDNVDLKSKVAMLKVALEAENVNFKMLRDTGVLPSASKEIHVSLEETKPTDKALVTDGGKTREQVLQTIETILTRGRSIPSYDDSVAVKESTILAETITLDETVE